MTFATGFSEVKDGRCGQPNRVHFFEAAVTIAQNPQHEWEAMTWSYHHQHTATTMALRDEHCRTHDASPSFPIQTTKDTLIKQTNKQTNKQTKQQTTNKRTYIKSKTFQS